MTVLEGADARLQIKYRESVWLDRGFSQESLVAGVNRPWSSPLAQSEDC